MLKYPLVVVEWDDASTDTEEYKDTVKDKKYIPCITYTCGFLVEEGEEGIVLFTDYLPTHKSFRVKHCIPNGMIKNVTKLS
jgi:hypothetical protein